MLKTLKPLCLAAALLCAGTGAQAAITVYTSQADFLSAVSSPGYDTFDDLSVVPYGSTLARTAGSYGYQAYSPDGLWGAGGAGDYWLSNENAYTPIVFQNFSGGVSAFGGNFFTSNISGQYVIGNLVLTADDGTTLNYALNGTTTSTFLGFVSDTALTSVTVAGDGGLYWPTANNVVLAVPEPATYGMLLAGIGLLGVAARRRR